MKVIDGTPVMGQVMLHELATERPPEAVSSPEVVAVFCTDSVSMVAPPTTVAPPVLFREVMLAFGVLMFAACRPSLNRPPPST